MIEDKIQKIRDWLQDEIENNKPVVNGEEEMADGTENIYVGRTELAETLLKKLDGCETWQFQGEKIKEVMMSNFLDDLESILTTHFGEDWRYEFDDDKPIIIHVPIERSKK
tara:strand:- start:22794 stop:23126 length:333 start_codon:yes stop_codon:yes gene_type:complete